ncbi:MAG: glycosyltransferase family 39 protein [Chloroflexota bacterium]
MHQTISFRILIVLAALVLCVPTSPSAFLPGIPLGTLGGLGLVGFAAAAIIIDRRIPNRAIWLSALLLIALLRWASGTQAPTLGWNAAYFADEQPSRTPERSTASSRVGSTRIDPALDFETARFPVHFFNDIRRFNFYRTSERARDTMPFTVSWSAVAVDVPPSATALVLVTNGPAEIQISDELRTLFPSTGSVREYPLPLSAVRPGVTLQVRYTRLFEVRPTLRLEWEDGAGGRAPVGSPHMAATEIDASSAWRATATQWAGSLSSLGLLALIAAALVKSSPRFRAGEPLPSSRSWPTWERAFLGFVVMWAAAEPLAAWLPFDQSAVLLSGGNDWLAYESFARDIQLNGLLMNNGRAPGTGEAYYYQPAYGYVLALLHQLLGESLGPVLWWQHASLGFVAVLVYGLARALWNPLAGVCAVLLVMSYRGLELFAVSGLLLSENLLFLVLPGMLWLFVRAYQRPTLGAIIAAGAALGLAGLTRSTPLLVYPFAILGMAVAARRSAGWRHATMAVAAFTVACFAVVSLATIRNVIVSGKPTLITTSAGANLIEAHRPTSKVDLKGIDQHPVYNRLGLDRQTREVLEFVRQDPQGYLETLWQTAAYALGYMEPILPGRGIEWPLLFISTSYAFVTVVVPATRRNGAWLVHAFILTHWLQTALFFSHQYGFRLPLPMYLVMFAVLGGAIASLVSPVERSLTGTVRLFRRPATVGAGLGFLSFIVGGSIAARWPAEYANAPKRLYALEGDVARIASALHTMPDTQQPDWAYGTGTDTRTREIAYLRSLAFPLIKWVDIDRGMVFPAGGRTGLLGAPVPRVPTRFASCTTPIGESDQAALYHVNSPVSSGCLGLTSHPDATFQSLALVVGATAPGSVRAGERFTSLVTWEVVERPDGRYRPQLELVGADQRIAARSENNPYGADQWSPGEVIASIHELTLEPTTPPGVYTLALAFVGASPRPNLQDSAALRYRAPLASITVEPPSQPLIPAQLGMQLSTPWQVGSLSFLGGSIARSAVHQGDPLDLTLAWQATDASPPPADLVLELSGPTTFPVIPRMVPLNALWPLERWRRGETVADPRTIMIPGDSPPGAYTLRLRDRSRPNEFANVAELTVVEHQRRLDPLVVRAASDAIFDSRVRLVGYDLRNRRLDAGDTVELGLTWQAASAISARYLVVISLVSEERGRVVYRREAEPGDGARPTSGWANGELVIDNHRIRTSRDLPRGRYRVRIELVEREGGRYLPTADGQLNIVLPPEVSVE